MSKRHSILIIEKDKSHREHLEKMLAGEGYNIIHCTQTMNAFKKLESNDIDLIICDFYLTSMRGKKFYKEISELFDDIPIIFLSRKADPRTIAPILAYPNADYMVKPIVVEELLARIMSFLQGDEINKQEKTLENGDLVLNLQTYKVYRDGKEIDLSPTEFKLLNYMMRNRNVVLTRKMILNKVWGYKRDVSPRIVDVYIGYLRDKIDKGYENNLIETVSGFGYKINSD